MQLCLGYFGSFAVLRFVNHFSWAKWTGNKNEELPLGEERAISQICLQPKTQLERGRLGRAASA